MTETSLTTQVPLWRKLLASAAGVLGAIFLTVKVGKPSEALILAIPVGGPAIAALIVHRPTLGPQLLARAIWWSNLGLGAFLCVVGGMSERSYGIMMVLGCGAALLVIGRKGLAEAIERAAFVPAAFRGSLLLLMVLALADAQSFAFFTIIEHDRSNDSATALALGAIAFTVGFIGLYRLAVWGALVSVATAFTLFVGTYRGIIRPSRELDALVLLITGVQMLAAAPMLLAMVRGKPLPAPPQRVRAILAPAAIIAVMVVSVSVGLAR
jgi:hypothetical protein